MITENTADTSLVTHGCRSAVLVIIFLYIRVIHVVCPCMLLVDQSISNCCFVSVSRQAVSAGCLTQSCQHHFKFVRNKIDK